jgi:hypothetical protein
LGKPAQHLFRHGNAGEKMPSCSSSGHDHPHGQSPNPYLSPAGQAAVAAISRQEPVLCPFHGLVKTVRAVPMGNPCFLARLSLDPTGLTLGFPAHTAHCLHQPVLALLSPPSRAPSDTRPSGRFFRPWRYRASCRPNLRTAKAKTSPRWL